MSNLKFILTAAVLTSVLSTGCATKRYPIATELSSAETQLMDCNDLKLEVIRVEQTQLQIADTASTDWRSAAGFLGDFGIGNAMAKSEADKALANRLLTIRDAQVTKGCPI